MSAVTLEAAHGCIERGIRKAQELGFLVAIAVVDDAGHLVACDRMNGALWVTPEIARAKANAAAAFQASTLDLEEHIVGAVGVSGAVPADNDHTIADAAAGHPVIPTSH